MAARPSVGTAITDWGEVFAVWTGTFVEGDLPADTDADGFTYITCRAVNGEDQGDFVATTAVPRGTPPDPLFIINDFVFQIENATGGSAGADDLFADGDTAVIPANTEITLNVVEISGTYDGTAFTGDDGTAPSADYATQLTSFAEDVAWTAVNAGHADMEMTADVLVLDAAMGDGVTGTVFPDNDREADFEGMLDIDRAAEGTFVPAAFDWSVDIDVVIDPVVPRVVGIMTPFGVDGDGYHLVDPLVATMLTYDFDWGTNVPVDMAGVGVTLFDLTDTVEVMEFTHTTDPEPAVNEYIIRDHPDPLVAEKQLLANLAAGNMAAEHVYALRLQVNPYNSVNDPGEFLARDGYPPEVVMNTIPEPDAVLDDNDHLWIFYPEPKVRRNPRAVFNILDDTIVPEDEEAFNDIIKTTGNEFIWENAGGGVPFPKVVLVEDPDNNLNPTDIEVSTTPDPGVNQAYTCPGYIVMDIGLLTTEGGPGMDPVHYDYRVFGAGAPLGNGEFTVIKELMDPLDPVGVDFGLNIFDGDLLVATRDFSDKNLDAGTVGTTNPDVLFVEFGEGEVGAWATVQDKLTNMTFVLSGGAGDTVFNWDPRLAINDDGTMICVHTFTALDFTNAGTPGWPGHIDSPGNQTVQLADNSGSIKDTFVDPLVVTGPNPND